jgi:hypothetical protein
LIDELPAGGKLRLIPEASSFFIPAGFSFEDLDLAVSDSLYGTYSDRDLSLVADAVSDGVSVLASTSSGSLDITLNSSAGIAAGSFVRLELGSVAEYGATGTREIINPETVGTYRLEIKSIAPSGTEIERSIMAVAIIEPVRMANHVEKARFEGTPFGFLNYGTTQALMSLRTNYLSHCRWSQTGTTSYYAMTEEFTYTDSYYHSTVIPVAAGGPYNYYVRCLDLNDGLADMTDYLITFAIAGFEGQGGTEDTEGSPGSGGGSGPGSGGGSGGGSGSTEGTSTSGGTSAVADGGSATGLPYPPPANDPLVSFQGYAYPNSEVTLLRDGKEDQKVTANVSGQFEIDVDSLPQGVYTFSLVGKDSIGRLPAAQSFTFYVKEGTKTQLYNVFLAPTIEVSDPSFSVGDSLRVFGQSAANADIELWLYPKVVGGVLDSAITKVTGKSGPNGEWIIDIDTSKLGNGPYQVKARSILPGVGMSDFSKVIDLMAGGELPGANPCDGADLNRDGKVNITDFSILLYWWNKDDDCADQNNDKTVNLVDFSIMMYHWTG